MSRRNGFSKADLNTLLDSEDFAMEVADDDVDHISKVKVKKSQIGLDPSSSHKKNGKHKEKKKYADEFDVD